jgi:hypothetical protein
MTTERITEAKRLAGELKPRKVMKPGAFLLAQPLKP